VDFSGRGIDDLDGLTGIIDEELFSGPVFLAKTGIEFPGPLMVEAAELTVLVALRIGFLVLQPKKLKRNTLFLQLLVKILRGRHLAFLLRHRGCNRKQSRLQGAFIEVEGKRPVQSGLLGSVQVIVDRASTDTEAFGYLSGRKTFFMMESKHLFDFTHG
jgi:hypothetical protein